MIQINKRSIGICILLSIITCGIYGVYWMYLLVKNTRSIQKNTDKCIGEMLCLIFVPFYSLYWWYTRGEKVRQGFAEHDYNATGGGVVYLVLAILGLSIVSMAIMQSDFNSLKSETHLEQRSTKNTECAIHKTSIGGQAVIEGVMMRGPEKIATSVRKLDGEIVTDVKEIGNVRKNKILKLPIIRGCVNFFDSMITGVKALMFSAKFFDVDEDGNAKEEEPSKFEKWLEKKLGSEKMMNAVIYFSVIVSMFFSIGLFILLPGALGEVLRNFIKSNSIVTLCEGIIRIIIFICYLALVSQMKDIKRVFMYHGAEHKSIHCYEHGEELTVENVRKHTRLHPRCGTSFLLIVMVVSMIIFFFIPKVYFVYRLLLRLALLPVVAGVSYEIIKYAGRHENGLTRIISAPGMWFQYITTKEPDDSQIEVAITSLKAVMPDNKEDDKW